MHQHMLKVLVAGLTALLIVGCSPSAPRPSEELVWNTISTFQQTGNPGITTNVEQLKQRYALTLLGPGSANIPDSSASSACLPEEVKNKDNINGTSWIVEVHEKSNSNPAMRLDFTQWENTDVWAAKNIDNQTQCIFLR